MPSPKLVNKKNTVRRNSMPRVTNNDIQASIIRLEEGMKPLVEAAARVPSLQEGQIRAEGSLKEHDTQIKALFKRADSGDTNTAELKTSVSTNVATHRAIFGTLLAVASIVMAVIGYFVSQQSSTLAAISDNTSKTAAAVISLDKRLTLAEYQLAHTQADPASTTKGAAK